jgi:peptidoglycan/LPS O-acetylase OafA/YrhL
VSAIASSRPDGKSLHEPKPVSGGVPNLILGVKVTDSRPFSASGLERRTDCPAIDERFTRPPISAARVSALDGARGLAIIGVLLVHSVSQLTHPLFTYFTSAGLARITEFGAFGVDLFFVLSGYLITGILLDTRHSAHYFRNFYARRFLRLFPVYYGYLLIAATVFPLTHRQLGISMPDYQDNWWWYVGYLSNWKTGNGALDPFLGHFWSLALEEQFYLTWPALIYFVPRRFLPWACIALALFSIALRFVWSAQGVYWNSIYRITITRLDTLVLGALVALAVRSVVWRQIVSRFAFPTLCGGMAAFVGIALYAGTSSWQAAPVQTCGAVAGAIAFAALVAHAALAKTGFLIRSILQTRILRVFGKYSYGIYVYHIAVFNHAGWAGAFIQKRIVQVWSIPAEVLSVPISILSVVISNAIVFLIAVISWRCFESRILRYKEVFRD